MIFHISSGRVVGNILNRVSLSNMFPTFLSPARFYQICQAAFGHCEHGWVMKAMIFLTKTEHQQCIDSQAQRFAEFTHSDILIEMHASTRNSLCHNCHIETYV